MIWKLQDRGFSSEIYIHASVIVIREFSLDVSYALTVCGRHPSAKPSAQSANPSARVEPVLGLIDGYRTLQLVEAGLTAASRILPRHAKPTGPDVKH